MVFVTRLSPGECLQALQRQAALPHSSNSFSSDVRVTMHGYDFRLSTLFSTEQPFYGTIEPYAAGSRIRGGFGNRWRRISNFILLSFPLALVALSIAIIGTIAVLWNLSVRLTGYGGSPWSTSGSLTIAGFMGALALTVIALRRSPGRVAHASIVDWIEKSLHATLEKSG